MKSSKLLKNYLKQWKIHSKRIDKYELKIDSGVTKENYPNLTKEYDSKCFKW